MGNMQKRAVQANWHCPKCDTTPILRKYLATITNDGPTEVPKNYCCSQCEWDSPNPPPMARLSNPNA